MTRDHKYSNDILPHLSAYLFSVPFGSTIEVIGLISQSPQLASQVNRDLCDLEEFVLEPKPTDISPGWDWIPAGSWNSFVVIQLIGGLTRKCAKFALFARTEISCQQAEGISATNLRFEELGDLGLIRQSIGGNSRGHSIFRRKLCPILIVTCGRIDFVSPFKDKMIFIKNLLLAICQSFQVVGKLKAISSHSWCQWCEVWNGPVKKVFIPQTSNFHFPGYFYSSCIQNSVQFLSGFPSVDASKVSLRKAGEENRTWDSIPFRQWTSPDPFL